MQREKEADKTKESKSIARMTDDFKVVSNSIP